jgi:hypothetical protein
MSARPSSAMLVRDCKSSANGACGRHERHDRAGMRLVTAASGLMTGRDLIYQLFRCVFELLALRLSFLPNSSAVTTIESIYVDCPEGADCNNEDE